MDHIYKKDFDDLLFINQSITVEEMKDLVKENVWKKNETLYFVDFPSYSNPGYECMTTKDAYNSNKPCSFPFYWRDKLVHNCSDEDTGGELWCYTKVNQELKYSFEGGWGLCRPECKGPVCFLVSTNILIIFQARNLSPQMLIIWLSMMTSGPRIFTTWDPGTMDTVTPLIQKKHNGGPGPQSYPFISGIEKFWKTTRALCLDSSMW